MKSIFRATAILGSSSVVSVIVGLISTKAWAVLLGPGGLGFMGLLYSLLGLAALVSGLGTGTAVVRAGANALARDARSEVAALQRAMWLLVATLGTSAALIMVLLQGPISALMLGGTEHSGSIPLLALALVFSLASSAMTSILNAHHKVGTLARIAILNSVLGAASTLVIVWYWREQGIAPAIAVSTAIGLAVSYYFYSRHLESPPGHPTRQQVREAARTLLRFGAPYTASIFVSLGVQLALPTIVLHVLGRESVGLYRAGVAISVQYLGFLLTAMALDYYPRISAVSNQPAELVKLVNQQQRLVLVLGVPMILGVLALAPYLVPLIYSPEFQPTVEMLEWQLIGDLFKYASWTLSYVILVHSGSVTFFFVELAGGLSNLVANWLGMLWFGLTGLGVGFLVAYLITYAVVWAIARRDIGLVWTRGNKRIMLAAVLALLIIRLLPGIGLEGFRTPVALLFAGAAGVGSLIVLWTEMGWKRLPGLQRGAEK